jgi:hypothetical protein
LVLLLVGLALVVFGAFVLIRMPTRPGGTIRARWFEVSSVGAGLPLIVVGVVAIVISQVDPFNGGDGGGENGGTVPEAARYFEESDGERGRVSFEGGAMYFEAMKKGRPLARIAQGADADRFRVRATYAEGAADHGVGLICRHEYAGRYYVFGISSDGRYNIVKYVNSKPRSLIGGFQESGLVDGRVNTLEARCEGESPVILTFLVNRAPVRPPVEDFDDPISTGAIGLRIGTPEPPVTVKFEDFEVLD